MEGLLIADNMPRTADLAHHFLEAVDQAAIASAAWRGLGDKNAADAAADLGQRCAVVVICFCEKTCMKTKHIFSVSKFQSSSAYERSYISYTSS